MKDQNITKDKPKKSNKWAFLKNAKCRNIIEIILLLVVALLMVVVVILQRVQVAQKDKKETISKIYQSITEIMNESIEELYSYHVDNTLLNVNFDETNHTLYLVSFNETKIFDMNIVLSKETSKTFLNAFLNSNFNQYATNLVVVDLIQSVNDKDNGTFGVIGQYGLNQYTNSLSFNSKMYDSIYHNNSDAVYYLKTSIKEKDDSILYGLYSLIYSNL